jgi:photosystem II stability/assembly factor-like uncharacterized protein
MSDPTASASGKHLYSVGSWLDAGIVKRQILRSADLGQSWCVLEAPGPVVEVAPSRAKDGVLYARSCPANAGIGLIFRSEDGGATWTTSNPPDGSVVCGIEMKAALQTSVTDPQTLWLTQRGRYTVDGVTYDGRRIHTSTDGGESWVSLNPPRPKFSAIYEEAGYLEAALETFVVDPKSPRRAIAAGTVRPAEPPYASQWFTTEDGGATWQPIPVPPEWSPGQDGTLTVDVNSSLYRLAGHDVVRSTDWGHSWNRMGRLPDPMLGLTTLGARQGGTLFAWRANAFAALDADDTVWRTADGGATWQRLALPIEEAVDPVSAPAGREIVAVGTAGWWATTDDGATWTPGTVVPAPSSFASSVPGQYWAGDTTAQSRQLTRARTAPALRSFDDATMWKIAGAAWGEFLFDSASKDGAFSLEGWSISRSDDRGETWAPVSPPPGLMVEAATCSAPASCLYVLLSESVDSQDACFVSKSVDRGRTWTERRSAPRSVCTERTLSVSPDDGDQLWAPCGAANCESRDGGRSWIAHPLAIRSDREANDIVALPGGVVLTTVPPAPRIDDDAPGFLARSDDGGATWRTVLPAYGLLFASRAAPRSIWFVEYFETGGPRLYRSDDAGATWQLRHAFALDDAYFRVTGIADRPRGGFLAATSYGLMTMD